MATSSYAREMNTRELTSKMMQKDGEESYHQADLILPEIQRL